MRLFKLTLAILPLMFFFTSCTIDDQEENEMEETTEITDVPLTGFIGAGQPFELNTALVASKTLFGDAGYEFRLFSTEQACVGSATPSVVREIDFFVPTDSALETREYDGEGPFIGDSSFFGCTVVITEVTDTSISGKVRGGDFDGDEWVEGAFTATICQ